jgi:tetratricopeptide (TPR) repeat protein
VVAVLPITLRNYAVSKDFVLVSSNAGVNFYIGNNELADGIFMLPPGSGLENTRLYLSSRDAAEKATGRSGLNPSEVSAYWTKLALDYMKQRPGDAAALTARKFHLFWNHYEIPNHHNKYYITRAYAPVLSGLVTGYGFVAPLAVVGLLLVFLARPVAPVTRLYAGFILVYMGSLIPFFITARYRLPVVPFLVVFASAGVWALAECFRKKLWTRAGWALAAGGAAAVLVWWPMVNYDFGFNHTVVGTVYSDKATEEPDKAVDHIKNAILEYKTALELRPLSVDAHYNLGVTYQRIGYYSGAVRELETAVALKPNHTYASKALGEVRASLEETGDKIDAAAVPRTAFELATDYTNRGLISEAMDAYGRVLEKDPQHAGAYSQMGAIHFERGRYEAAIKLFKKGLRYKPDHFVLNNNIAGAYFKTGNHAAARRHWERCLEIDPDNESVKRQLRLVGR